MTETIDFYFDFSSPYGYFAACRIDALATRRRCSVNWRPYMMGAAMKLTGARPLLDVPLVADYARQDMSRSARLYGIPFALPEPFPIAALAPTRAFYWLHDRDPAQAKTFAQAAYTGYFAAGRDISDPEVVAEIGHSLGVAREELKTAIQDPAIKTRVKAETEAAIERQVFGSPFFIVDEEAFWGSDRMDQLERWLDNGGW